MENQNKNPKQVIIVRTDLKNSKGEKIRTGKIAAQVAHASLGVIMDMMSVGPEELVLAIPLTAGYRVETTDKIERKFSYERGSMLEAWLDGRFTKICLRCDSEEELLDLFKEVGIHTDLPCKLITDAGLTEFGGVPTNTCIAIGPGDPDEINKITGHLKLL